MTWSLEGKARALPAWCQCWSLWVGEEDRHKSKIQGQADSKDWKQVHPLLPLSLAKARFLCRALGAVTTGNGSGQ